MTLEQLRIFIAVAEREHVTEAAKFLGLTQSAVSAAVAALEERHAVRLFDRVGRRIELTLAGKLFLGEARAVLARADAAVRMLDDLTGLSRGTLSLAASQTVGNYWLPPVMQRFRRAHPGIALTLVIGNTEQTCRAVEEGAADLGFVEDVVRDASLRLDRVAGDELLLFAAPDHPLVAKPSIGSEDLRQAVWVMREAGSGTRAILAAMLRGQGIDPARITVALELPSNEAVRAAVEAGGGVSVLSRLVVAASLQAGTLAALDFALPERGFFAVRHADRHPSQAAAAFLKLLG
ncbi:LysR family transcriptional regulator [Aureimonas glaciei]|uniref:LysR family transcriptional regulator n=1 Tax=Aureimonas glaciei TaxID=1776957 RepID=A0A916YGH8_9HYPH|nr:LysR family transcriptional regulator [Aureimonas glaciei]GGD44045.1 LysR family transcriptional regulator [Aureimonas glaciei]